MKSNFNPTKLLAIIPKIKELHPLTASSNDYSNSDFIKILNNWVSLSLDDIEQLAPTITKRRIEQLIEYIAKNSLKLPTDNLNRIIQIRLNDKHLSRLFQLWQDNYYNNDLYYLLKTLVKSSSILFNNLFSNSELSLNTFKSWLESMFLPTSVGNTAINIKRKKKISFEKALQSLKILIDGKLGKECIESFYTYCNRDDYLSIDDIELENILRLYSENKIHLFLHNIIQKLEVTDFQNLYYTGSFLCDNYTGDNGSYKYKSFMINYTDSEKDKYNKWLAYIFIRKNINDYRMSFWNNFVANWLKGYEYFKTSRCIVFKFQNYCVLEFTEATKGPLYIYENFDFEKRIRPKANRLKNKDLRYFLFHNDSIKRIEHTQGWQSKVNYYLKASGLMF